MKAYPSALLTVLQVMLEQPLVHPPVGLNQPTSAFPSTYMYAYMYARAP
jgi:hypothetical protein